MDDFPSSVSCVSEITAGEEAYQSPSLYPTLLKVAPEFQTRFPGFRPSAPLYSSKHDGTDVISIGFLYKEHDISRYATLVYELKKRNGVRWFATFNPYTSSPQPHQQDGIDWIKLYHIEFEPAVYALEKALEEYYSLNMNHQTLSDGSH